MGPRSRDDHEQSQDGEPPAKMRRTSRACIQCRMRKQKCDGPVESEQTLPCRRCCQLGATCSFTTTPPENEGEHGTLSNTVHKVGKILKQVTDHQRRIQELEKALRDLREEREGRSERKVLLENTTSVSGAGTNALDIPTDPGTQPQYPTEVDLNQIFSPSNASSKSHPQNAQANPSMFGSELPSPPPTDSGFTMDAVDLDTPMSTLRNLKTLSKERTEESAAARSMTYDPILPVLSRKDIQSFEQDPIVQGIMTLEEAQQAFDIFFTHCHPHAPFLCIQTQRSASYVRQTSPTLFLSVCTIGARFWQAANSQMNYEGLHSGYQNLVSLLDTSISRLLLQPTLSDVNLDHIRSLLLYIQWMPTEQHTPGICQTRYNDISAWSVLGLAIRYAIFLGLDRTAIKPFLPESTDSPTQEDFSRLRVWINILTCDCHLMLSAGLPASLDPEPMMKIVRNFAFHKDSLQPGDAKIAAICELVTIVKKAAKSSGDPSVRSLDAATLKKTNSEFDTWESFWISELSDVFHHSQIPFTSFRWYRLATNSAGLGSILSPKSSEQPMQLSLLQALDNSLTAAAQTIFALANETNWQLWPAQCQSLSSFPSRPFTINEAAIGRFRFAVDSAWITHSFAAVFLVLCYTRGAIDDELQILHLAHSASVRTVAPAAPRPSSLFFRLISLASQIFDTICRTSAAHPAADYRTIINNVFSVILKGNKEEQDTQGQQAGDNLGGLGLAGEDMSMDGLFEMMLDAGFNWQGGLFKDDGLDYPVL
ncbi:uncharacterized protein LY89DRAFT_683068 [Mollisia scopiformis]|uniref:Zn(2)-C6 fungal-type domain-containing protein n=1 Tax=Mollisia scopiformis TaxID=149040 RepID=A0A194XG77_MOLSC|nr:uncharacterized protein LY89DRAFT_683068 [Mollisia scopiformis]KUJ19134.1 hypothetical protein LY89DRAFT_683068 [Mollisia scopiformis]